jgi:hypothetical protein
VLGVARLRFSILGRLASSVLMVAARFLVIERRRSSWEGSWSGGAGGPEEDKGFAGEVSDPCWPAAAGGPTAPAGLAAMAERVRGPVGAGWCRGCEELGATSVIFFLLLGPPTGVVDKREGWEARKSGQKHTAEAKKGLFQMTGDVDLLCLCLHRR